MPPLSAFPQSHQVTFKYYCGVIHFLEEDYTTAEEHLTSALQMCSTRATKNLQLILTYLIPTRLLTSHKLPSPALLAPYPRLQALFSPIAESIRTADLSAFNAAMEAGEDEFVKRRIYLTLERGKDIILRNIFRKVFMAGGFDAPKEDDPSAAPARRTRVPVKEFAAALLLAGAEVGDGEGGIDGDEVECMIANAIYKVGTLLLHDNLNPARDLAAPQFAAFRGRHPLVTPHGPTFSGAWQEHPADPSYPEPDERLHRSRAWHRRAQQSGCIPGHRSLSHDILATPPAIASITISATLRRRAQHTLPHQMQCKG